MQTPDAYTVETYLPGDLRDSRVEGLVDLDAVAAHITARTAEVDNVGWWAVIPTFREPIEQEQP